MPAALTGRAPDVQMTRRGGGVYHQIYTMTAVRAVGTTVQRPGRPTSRPRLAWYLGALIVTAIATSAEAQPAASGEPPAQTAPQTDAPAAAPSPASLERIKRALNLRRTDRARASGLEFREDILLHDQRPEAEPLRNLGVVAGVDYDPFSRIRPATPGALPGHWDMVAAMTPREATEAGSADVMGIATAAAFSAAAFTLVPAAIKAIGGWFDADDTREPTAPPVLTRGEASIALADVSISDSVINADIDQRGRTVALSLTVRADTPPTAAHALGEKFVRLVKTMAATEPTPGDDLGTGAFDYVVHIRTPSNGLLARGGKSTADRTIHW